MRAAGIEPALSAGLGESWGIAAVTSVIVLAARTGLDSPARIRPANSVAKGRWSVPGPLAHGRLRRTVVHGWWGRTPRPAIAGAAVHSCS